MNPPAALAAFAQLKAGAAARGTDIEVMTAVAEGAFAAGNAGDSATHDRLVIEAVERTAGMVDVICLAQVSMAMVRARAQAKSSVPVLTSPAMAVARSRTLVSGGTAS